MTKTHILVVDDEPQIQKLLRAGLSGYDYDVIVVANGQETLTNVARHQTDIIVLDINLGDSPDGLDVCRALREWTTIPIIMLSVNDDKKTKLAALDAGADDYITKPFDMEELAARIRAVLRRSVVLETNTVDGVIEIHDLVIDLLKRRVTLKGSEIHLTPTEYKLLCALAKHPGRVLTFNMLIQAIKDEGESSKPTHYVRVYINSLRKKLQDDPMKTTKPLYIFNEPGIGYRFADVQPVR